MDVVREGRVIEFLILSNECFNPCSNGCRSGSYRLFGGCLTPMLVSILVLMDVVREDLEKTTDFINKVRFQSLF